MASLAILVLELDAHQHTALVAWDHKDLVAKVVALAMVVHHHMVLHMVQGTACQWLARALVRASGLDPCHVGLTLAAQFVTALIPKDLVAFGHLVAKDLAMGLLNGMAHSMQDTCLQ